MNIRIVKKLHEHIIMERTGNPKELAIKLGVSERIVYCCISFIKTEMNAPIIYDNQKGNYLYEREYELRIKG